MTSLIWLVPIALGMGIAALLAFLWSMRSGQYDDLKGAAERVLLDQEEDRPLTDPRKRRKGDEGAQPRASNPKSQRNENIA